MQAPYGHKAHDNHHLSNCHRIPAAHQLPWQKDQIRRNFYLNLVTYRTGTFQLHSISYTRLQTKLKEESMPFAISVSEQLPSHSLATASSLQWSILSLLQFRRTKGPQVATCNGTSPNSCHFFFQQPL